jgi:hypothetical protein
MTDRHPPRIPPRGPLFTSFSLVAEKGRIIIIIIQIVKGVKIVQTVPLYSASGEPAVGATVVVVAGSSNSGLRRGFRP